MKLTRRGISRAVLLVALVLSCGGCHRETLAVFDVPPIPLGRKFEVPVGRHSWAFHAPAGQKFRLDLEWPDGQLEVRAGSDWRDKGEEDGDDLENVTLAEVQAVGPHHWTANWTIGPKANTGFFSFGLAGGGRQPIKVEIDRQ